MNLFLCCVFFFSSSLFSPNPELPISRAPGPTQRSNPPEPADTKRGEAAANRAARVRG